MPRFNDYDTIIIGAGGAGLMCAAMAGRYGAHVLVLDHNDRVGRKILISGGGRCNFTNQDAQPKAYVSKNPHFCKSALAAYRPADFVKLVEQYRIPYYEKKLGQLFCRDSAQDIVDLLLAQCEKSNVEIALSTRVLDVSKQGPNEDDGQFAVTTDRGNIPLRCRNLVVATGGLSIPQIGATGFGYDLARSFGLAIVPTRPALDGFVFKDDSNQHLPAGMRLSDLSGVSLDSIVSVGKTSFRENILFTHKGLSGPAALQASLFFDPAENRPIKIDLGPDIDFCDFLLKKKRGQSKQDVKNILSEVLPKRLAEYLCEVNRWHANLSGYADNSIEKMGQTLKQFQIHPRGTVGYSKAEVTRGGVDCDELDGKSMAAKKVKGLYFIGEVVDVTGLLGGYNFQWAWASAYQAAQHLCQS